jgi:parvulin-like peptidyl-prolyl isomerase
MSEEKQEDKEKDRKKAKSYYARNREKVKQKAREKYEKDKAIILQRRRELYNDEEHKEKKVQYYQNNKEHQNERQRNYHNNLYQDNIQFKIKTDMRARLRCAIFQDYGCKSMEEYIGCKIQVLREHIESLFEKGMSWDNYGKGWEIDHINPVKDFDLTIDEELKKAYHYTNIRPRWSKTNRSENHKQNRKH